MSRVPQCLLIVSTLLASWLGMQAIHEAGHIVAARLTGGVVARVVLHPLTISRTDLAHNPAPLVVVWAGPLFGVLVPLLVWATAALARLRGAFLLRFFAGFCLIANGAYIAGGSFDGIGDAGDMLRHGAPMWQLWLFGVLTLPAGLWLWHGQGEHFGLGRGGGRVHPAAVCASVLVCLLLVALGFAVG
jgi:hypothetical protein